MGPRKSRRVLIVAGDPSGDCHGALLVRAVRQQAPEVKWEGAGGTHLKAAGVHLLAHSTALAAIGLLDALCHVPPALRLLRCLQRQVRQHPPDLAVLIDFGAFNLRFGRWLRGQGVPVLCYFPPGSWTNSRRRAADVAAIADKIATPFPKCLPAYEALGAEVVFVGHPLVDQLQPWAERVQPAPAEAPKIALLPGSRPEEVKHHLPVLLGAAARLRAEFPSAQFVVSVAPHLAAEQVQRFLARVEGPVETVVGSAAALAGATLGLVKSGTVTLEAALLGVPMVVFYRVAWANYLLGWLTYWPRPKYIAMPNILADAPLVPELVQGAATPTRLAAEAGALLRHATRREAMRQALREAVAALGPPGATARAAKVVLEMLGLSSCLAEEEERS
ncbi:MAG TPA: lipid-A-disaccharide synthase [Armatimonadetes bacterium]|nr:lipid-A-disaccharide synthase [Armatimonadota bacterium]